MYFVEGAVIGFSLAAPIGPVGILCVRPTLEHGARYGLVIGASAACWYMVNDIVAAFGITLISNFIAIEQYWTRSHATPRSSASGYEFGDEIRHARRQAADQGRLQPALQLGSR